MLTITYAEFAKMRPCDLERRKTWFEGTAPLGVAEALEKGATVRDVLWVAQKLGRKDLCVRFALLCAQRVAHLNPDPRVQAALDATENWLNDPSEVNRKDDAADAAYAYAAAADAYAAYAAYAADAADADAARQKEQEAQKQILIEVFSPANI